MTSLGERTSTLLDAIGPHGERPALITPDGICTHAELRRRSCARAAELELVPGRLVALEATPTESFVSTYLAAHGNRSPVLVVPTGSDDLLAAYRPGLVVRADGSVEHGEDPGPMCHPDLALALSTSGSTGAPRLVRLSHNNVVANARAIAEYLGLSPTDRSITSLPLHYCYGLSVLHSHLLAGGSLVLSAASVVDPCWSAAVREHAVTTVAAVPHTMELLEQIGFADADLPRLRAVTVAGGRLAADRVRHWSQVGQRRGWDLYVMYGQTEATARMAYLPPMLCAEYPHTVGIPIPGGSFELRPHPASDDPGVGEVVYRGPNVMLGYADGPEDLTRGAELEELATGDLGRIDPDHGLLELVGRARRFVKPLGVRVDLDQLEQRLAARGVVALCTGTDEMVVVAATAPCEVVGPILRQVLHLPPGAVRLLALERLPRLVNGKPDYPQVLAAAQNEAPQPPTPPSTVLATVSAVLGGDLDPRCSFVECGGDSLSYVECSVRLTDLLGSLPPDWHLVPLEQLERLATPAEASAPVTRTVPVDTTVVLRALAICAVVATHMHLWRIPGGAHLMLAVSGYNFSRFVLARPTVTDRLGATARLVAGVAVPTMAWIGASMAIAGEYSRGSLFLVNNYFGSPWRTGGRWRYWYVEVLIQLVMAAMVIVALPGVRRLQARQPYVLALGLLALCLVPRYRLVDWGDDYNLLYRTHWVAWCFLLGWLVHRSRSVFQRALTSALIVATIPGFFDRPQREWAIVAGLVVLVWWRELRVPRRVVPILAALAASSLWILLVHWEVFPVLRLVMWREVAYAPTLAAGVGAWWLAERVRRSALAALAARRAERVPRRRPARTPVGPGAAPTAAGERQRFASLKVTLSA